MECLGWNRFNNYVLKVVSGLGVFTLSIAPAWGQITPIGDTTVHSTTDGSPIHVTGGVSSADGTNLFHQFETFNVNTPETVNFVAPATVDNVLSRISGGQISTIDGGLGVSNDANLWLINPAGIVFGPNAYLNLQGDFTAATADAIGFENGWFTDENDYQALVGPPRSFAFIASPSNLINLGNLEVERGQNLTLLGGSVVNGGNLSAPAGTITIAAVANTNRVILSQPGQLLTLEIEPWSDGGSQLPTLLTGQGGAHADTLTLAADGTIHLSQKIPGLTPATGHASISGHIQSTGDHGGQIAILGERISLMEADIRADGLYRGGNIYIGGNYQGAGPLPNATHTSIDQSSHLSASALHHGDGGQIIVWADQATYFGGNVQAQGGESGGNGGLIEISGKSKLGFIGQFSVSAPHGEFGTVLFDPDNIEVVDGFGAANGDLDLLFAPFGTVVADDGDSGWFTIHEGTLELWNGNANIVLQANNDIIVRNLGGDNELAFQAGSGSISFIADADNSGAGEFLVEHAGDLINTAGRDIMVSGHNIDIQAIDTYSVTGAGDISLIAQDGVRIRETINGDDISIQANGIDFNGGDDSVSGNTLTLKPLNPAHNIVVGTNTSSAGLDLLSTDIQAIKDGFTNIAIGRTDGTGDVILSDIVADGGIAEFKDPVTILGADTLHGPEQVTTWTITGNNQGNLDSVFSNGLTFENVNTIAASNNTSDIIQGTDGNDQITLLSDNAGNLNGIDFRGIHSIQGGGGDDSFIFANGATTLSGYIDGGAGNNTLDHSNYITDIVVDLETDSVSGTGGVSNIQKIIGGLGFNTIRGTLDDDVITLASDGDGAINNVIFQGFETVIAGNGNDRFLVNGGTWTSLDGGLGTDVLDYSANPTMAGITIDLQTASVTAINSINSIETFVGSNNSDTLTGTNNNDIVLITGNNIGQFNSFNFIDIENHDGGAGDDIFFFNDGASITGTLTGGDGTDKANYNNYTTAIEVDLQTNSATGISRFETLESFIGGSNDDIFRLSAANPFSTIKGGAGSDTLVGDDVAGVWNLTAVNTGNGTGITNFSNIENLTAGNQSDQVNFLSSGARFTGALDGGDGPLALKGDSIVIGTAITGTDALVIEPASTDKDIHIGGPGLTPALDISTPELNTIDHTFTSITIGHPEGNGAITFGAAVSLPAPTTIQSPNSDGTINTQGFDLAASELILSAAQEIVTANLTAPGGVKLTSDNSINIQDILTQDLLNGGNVIINAGNTLTIQQIDTTGINGGGGNVTLNAPAAIQVGTIRAEGNAAGGNVTIATDQFVQLTDQFTSLDGDIASISTAATNGTGEITIRHGGNSLIPFEIGDSSLLGSDAAITTGDFKLSIDSVFPNSYNLGNILLLTQDITSSIDAMASPIDAPVISPVPSLEPVQTISFNSPLIDRDSSSIEALTDSIGTDDSNKALFERLESSYSEQFKSHLDLYERVSVSPTNLDTAQQTLSNVEALMDIKPGVLYVYFLPPTDKDKAIPDSSGLNPHDELGLLLLTHNGQTVRRKVKNVTRGDVMVIAEDFYAHITNSVSTSSQYLPPAQQLYDWFITPIEDELQQQGIQSLAMAMDTGLRTLPMAALHNGEEFLVERYSLGVIPSFSLTDFNPQNFLYTQLENTQLLAMGASQFPSQQLLPAVPEELTIVTQTFHDSEVFLNEDFTLNNLQHQVARNEFGIVHLASHGVFEPGEPSQSYIQLWDQSLQLDQVHTLGLQEANIALMVLSACNTALGDREAEYGFAGLAVNAGVQTSVASLWPISDEGTLGLMTYFYQHLQQQPVRATALREAQLAMLRGDLQFADGTLYGLDETPLSHFPELEYHGRWNFEHPFYWSTYTLVGSPW